MNERIVQLRVGLMVLASLLITLILLALFNEPRAFIGGAYDVRIIFPQAPGVTKDTPVRKSGVLIGRVAMVDLIPEGGALVIARIDGNRELRRNEEFHITSTLLGDAALEVVPSRDRGAAKTLIKDGDEVIGIVHSDPIQVIANLESSLAAAIHSVANTSDELGDVIHQVGILLENNTDQIERIIAQSTQTLETIQEVADNANNLIGDPQTQQQFRDAIALFPKIAEDAHATINRLNDTFASLERNLKNIEGLTEPLGERGEFFAQRLDQGVEKLDLLLDEMLIFSKALNNPRNPLRQFLDDEEFYPHVQRTVKNIDELTRRLRPIVDDARVTMDKIARDPSRLGVGGALRKSSPLK